MNELDRLARRHAERARATTESVSMPPLPNQPVKPTRRRPLVVAAVAFTLTLIALAPLVFRQQQPETTQPSSPTIATTSTTIVTSTTAEPPPAQVPAIGEAAPFMPPSYTEGDRVVFPVTFLDGTRLEVILPHTLADLVEGFAPAAEVGWDFGTCCGRSLDVRHGTIADLFGDATPITTYTDAAGNPVPYYAVAQDDLNYLAFQFGSWVVLAWDGGSEEFSEADRARFASLLDGHETDDGFLVLDPVAPMVVRGTDSPDGRFDGSTRGDALIGILLGEGAKANCESDVPTATTARGYAVKTFETNRLGVCTPDQSVLLHITGVSLSQDDLDQIEVRSPSPTTPTGGCEDASWVVATFTSRLPEGTHLEQPQMLLSRDPLLESWYFISARIVGGPEDGQVATWAFPKLDPTERTQLPANMAQLAVPANQAAASLGFGMTTLNPTDYGVADWMQLDGALASQQCLKAADQ
jgi:hypothetical protein